MDMSRCWVNEMILHSAVSLYVSQVSQSSITFSCLLHLTQPGIEQSLKHALSFKTWKPCPTVMRLSLAVMQLVSVEGRNKEWLSHGHCILASPYCCLTTF